jgi:hypothetical protein
MLEGEIEGLGHAESIRQLQKAPLPVMFSTVQKNSDERRATMAHNALKAAIEPRCESLASLSDLKKTMSRR